MDGESNHKRSIFAILVLDPFWNIKKSQQCVLQLNPIYLNTIALNHYLNVDTI